MLSIIGTIFDFVSFHYQRTALHIAAKEGQKVIMEILVDKEADVNMKDNDEVSVYMTVTAGKFEYLMPNLLISKTYELLVAYHGSCIN